MGRADLCLPPYTSSPHHFLAPLPSHLPFTLSSPFILSVLPPSYLILSYKPSASPLFSLCCISLSAPPTPSPPVLSASPRSTHHVLLFLPPAAHMQAKKRYLLVSVGAGLLFLVYLWALQIGEFQQQPYQYHQFPQYPQYHQYHQQEYQYYRQSQEVYQPQPLPQRSPSRPPRHWPESGQLLEPYLEGGEQEVDVTYLLRLLLLLVLLHLCTSSDYILIIKHRNKKKTYFCKLCLCSQTFSKLLDRICSPGL